jgi:hypothetical protein
MLPHEMWRTSVPELMAFIDGYRNRLRNSWEQSRLIAYTVHRLPYEIFGKADELQEMEDWMPLWSDDSPEDRVAKRKLDTAKQGMVAEHQLEEFRKLGINI